MSMSKQRDEDMLKQLRESEVINLDDAILLSDSEEEQTLIQENTLSIIEFKVKFYVPPFLPIIPVTGDYWVLYIDPDYQHALIGQPSRSYLWILSRTSHMEEDTYKSLVEKAVEEGYDISKLHKTPQSDTPPESETAPDDSKDVWWLKSLFGK